METKVTLIDWPRWPIETVYFLWEAARNNEPLNWTPQSLHEDIVSGVRSDRVVRETFEKIIDSSIPIAENLNFTFLLEGVSISFREQMVRHKIGVKVGERLGVDMFPDIHDSTWWVQSMRVLDMGKFADTEAYRIPDSIKFGGPEVWHNYNVAMASAQETYKKLLAAGVPIEDAREVIPLGAQHRLSWTLNLSALIHITKKRSCVIPQIGTWGPVIEGMIEELATKVDPYFRNLVTPPCMKGDKFMGCIYKLDNERRVSREDPLQPCSLYMHHEKIDPETVKMDQEKQNEIEEKYRKFWGRDTRTGRRINSSL